MTGDPIPPGELEGLQAFEVRVGTHVGDGSSERPQWVELDGQRAEVAEVESEWDEEERLGFFVRLRDHRRMLLYYVPNEDFWSGVVLT